MAGIKNPKATYLTVSLGGPGQAVLGDLYEDQNVRFQFSGECHLLMAVHYHFLGVVPSNYSLGIPKKSMGAGGRNLARRHFRTRFPPGL